MNETLASQLAQRFQRARSLAPAQARAELVALLHPQVRYMVLGKEVAGANSVADELLGGNNGELARRLEWQAPQCSGANARLMGNRRAGTRDRGLIVTLTFEGDAIALVQEQRTPPPPVPAERLVLPEALKRRIDNALVERHPMLVAHVDAQGQPVLSFRGSVQAFSDDQLAMWIRSAEGGFIRAIRSNPHIALMYRDEEAKATYQFQGRARVTTDAADREKVFQRTATAERAHDFAKLGVAVIVDLDRVEGYAGLGPQGQVDGIRMLRDPAAEPQS